MFYPAYDGPALGPPLCILALAAPLLDHGFQVVIIDAAINADAPQRILRECSDALCLGISVLTGPMITAALNIARLVKAALPDLPVVFGGWHPTLTAEQTLDNDLVNVVVRGPGELTLLRLFSVTRWEKVWMGWPVFPTSGMGRSSTTWSALSHA